MIDAGSSSYTAGIWGWGTTTYLPILPTKLVRGLVVHRNLIFTPEDDVGLGGPNWRLDNFQVAPSLQLLLPPHPQPSVMTAEPAMFAALCTYSVGQRFIGHNQSHMMTAYQNLWAT